MGAAAAVDGAPVGAGCRRIPYECAIGGGGGPTLIPTEVMCFSNFYSSLFYDFTIVIWHCPYLITSLSSSSFSCLVGCCFGAESGIDSAPFERFRYVSRIVTRGERFISTHF